MTAILQKQEQRLVQREEILDKKEENLLKQNAAVEQQKKDLLAKENEVLNAPSYRRWVKILQIRLFPTHGLQHSAELPKK